MKTLFVILTVLTTYVKGMYNTDCALSVNASAAEANQVVDRLIYEFQRNPDLLFDWAFVGTGQQNDAEKDAFVLHWNNVLYVPERNYSRIDMEVQVPGIRSFKNIVLESMVTDTLIGLQRNVRVDIFYAGNLLKEAYGNFCVMPIADNQCTLSIDLHIRFGWFFNIFVSRRVYRNVVEWRVERFMSNLKEMTETGTVQKN
ncbi:MAG: hypothetical protein NC038_05715 [Paludibacter sp.]|nr:hypothetical protein [Bacteroidales bacterium]MCM1068797.1 hypothetical protein [Prevotella sp.]MCM1353938.1 hypothetical protein [Bacteroides sp.]MCM1443336.1 hypothetical protein [Muribaculum sp.]MCM1482123.1 hypothetical protein [Paludibacter sp.]